MLGGRGRASASARVTPGRGSRAADREREPRLSRPTAVDVLGSRALPHSPLRADSALLFRSCVRFSVSSLSSDIRREASRVAGRLCSWGTWRLPWTRHAAGAAAPSRGSSRPAETHPPSVPTGCRASASSGAPFLRDAMSFGCVCLETLSSGFSSGKLFRVSGQGVRTAPT